MVAIETRRAADAGLAMFLSVICPGLGQLYQGRFAAAAHFLLDTAALVMLMLGAPAFRVPTLLGLLGVGAWSVFDARRAASSAYGRRAAGTCSAACQ